MLFDLKAIAADVKLLILQAGEMIQSAWDEQTINSHLKDERDIVTDTDVEVENYLRKYLYNILPQSGFIVEEGKTEMMGEYNWIIDPIDGTKLFAAHVPLVITQVALVKNDEPVVSFCYNPITKQLFHAIKDQGAYYNDVKIIAKHYTPVSKSIIHIDSGSLKGASHSWKSEFIQRISQACYRVHQTAGTLAPYLALGAVDVSINLDIETPYSIKNQTDIKARSLLFQECGYTESILKHNGHSILIWGSEKITKEIKELL